MGTRNRIAAWRAVVVAPLLKFSTGDMRTGNGFDWPYTLDLSFRFRPLTEWRIGFSYPGTEEFAAWNSRSF